MSPVALSRFVALATAMSAMMLGVVAQDPTVTPAPTDAPAPPAAQATYPATPLAQKGPFQYPDGIPYKVDTDTNLIRGPQIGFNICNGTTENQNSLCQTSWLNSLDDFCLWGPPEYGKHVGDIEGIMVAYCTKPGHGTRLIPAGALTGVQLTKTPDYIQVVGFIDQTKINIVEGDWGGEMDPHGADLRGNPMGGIKFSTAFGGQPQQVIEWHNFVGGNRFCMKLCDPAGPNAAHFCEHIYDRIGMDYNCPTNAQDGVFESCEGENQDFPGTYTQDGVVMTYTQPPESLGAISTIPYTARTPSSSNCQTFSSAAIYTGLPTVSGSGSTATPTGSRIQTSGSKPTGSGTKPTGTAADPSQTGAGFTLDAASALAGLVTFIGFAASVAMLS